MQPFNYHQSTKHSYFSVRSNPNRLDWDNQPKVFKHYSKNYQRFELNYAIESHRFILLSFGLTAKKSYPGVEYYLRVNPSAGALYPNEIYFQVRNQEGFQDGIYHYETSTNHVVLLYALQDDGLEPYLGFETAQNGFVFFVSAVYYRSSWKYKNRAFRYCLLDAGHLLGAMEASSYVLNKSYDIIYDFDKKALNKLFGFENQEFFLSAFSLLFPTQNRVQKVDCLLPFVDATGVFERNELIEFAYEQSKNITKKPQLELPQFYFEKERFEQVITKRRSIREFAQASMKKYEFESILRVLEQNIPSDCDEQVNIYCVINRVEQMPLGLYFQGDYLLQKDLKSKAGYLCLEQVLGSHSAVTFFLTSGAKNYQALYQKAGIIGHRLYLASNYLDYGCSGIGAYYDDEVNELLGNDEMVLYALAIGN